MELKAQTKWGWLIAAYLFLAGLGGGAYVTGAVAAYLGAPEWSTIAKIGVSLGFPCVAVGCLFLLADLGSLANFWRAGMRPNTSWIARGTIIITLFMVMSLIHVYGLVFTDKFAQASTARNVVSALGIIFAFGTMIYTGILLAAARPIAFWSTAMLPLLFLVSALSTGMMTVILIGTIAGGSETQVHTLARLDVLLIVLEIIVLAFFLQGTHRVSESRASAQRVLTGDVAPLFWWGVAVLGLLVPLLFELLNVPVVAAVCGIIGGLFLRQVILLGGIHAPLRAGRFEIALPIV